MTRALMWFRNDLRIEDNPAWSAATRTHDEVVPVVVLDDRLLASAGPFRRSQWLANVDALARTFTEFGSTLTIVRGQPEIALRPIAATCDQLFYNASTSGWGRARDERVVATLTIDHEAHWGTLVSAPGTVLTSTGTVSRVFTSFGKAWRSTPLDPWPEPGAARIVEVDDVASTRLPDFAKPMFPVGTAEAHAQLSSWLDVVDEYAETRDYPGIDGTSRLSAALRHGTISPRTVLDVVGTATAGREAFVRQLAWRDWYAHLMFELPDMIRSPVKESYDRIPWRDDPEALVAWQQGLTGYPIVDAGMRQLSAIGWMHNRVRMLVGSFLVKDLLIDWREGERWFRRLLVDGEPSQNAGNWQWVAGTGTDAAPYFRIFNPITQSRKFDSDGSYIRRWVPELAQLDNSAIHAPWQAGPLVLASANVVLGETYPLPIVDHAAARQRALAAYKSAIDR